MSAPATIDQIIGSNVRVLRKSKKLSQEKVALALDIHQTALCRVEAGLQKLSLEQMLAFCVVARCPILRLFRGVGIVQKLPKRRQMSRRDRFIAMAMPSMVNHASCGNDNLIPDLARVAIKCADALIAELAKPKTVGVKS